jgi:hypothetical protein
MYPDRGFNNTELPMFLMIFAASLIIGIALLLKEDPDNTGFYPPHFMGLFFGGIGFLGLILILLRA